MMKRTILLVVYIVVIATLSSCTHQIRPVLTLSRAPVVERLPLVIGLYQSQAFQQYVTKQYFYKGASPSYNYYESFDFEIGKPSVKILNEILQSMFERVVLIDDLNKIPKGVAAILEPNIEEFTWPAAPMAVREAEVRYLFTLSDNEKHHIGTVRVTGKGESDTVTIGAGLFYMIREASELAIKDAMAQFTIAFQEQPEIKQWLLNRGIILQKQEATE